MSRRPLDILNCFVVATLLLLAVICQATGRLHRRQLALLRCALLLGRRAGNIRYRRAAASPRSGWLATPVNLLVDFYPLVLIPLVYDALGFLIPALNPVEKDRWLIAADRAIFGLDPTVWLQRFIWSPLTDVLYLAYSMFFFIPLIVGIPLWRPSPLPWAGQLSCSW